MQGRTVMRRSGAETLVTEEPYELIAHIRVCGEASWATTGSTRKSGAGRCGVRHGRRHDRSCDCAASLGVAVHPGDGAGYMRVPGRIGKLHTGDEDFWRLLACRISLH